MMSPTPWDCNSLQTLSLLFVLLAAGSSQARLDWVRRPENTAVRLGDDLTISCEALWVEDGAVVVAGPQSPLQSPSSSSSSSSSSANSQAPPSPTLQYTWALNQTPLPEKVTRLPDNSLFVPSTASTDLGNYTCAVTARFEDAAGRENFELVGSALVISAFLQPFLIHPESQNFSVGETARLTCVTGKSSPVVEVSWLLDGLPFTQGEVQTASFGGYDPTGLTHQLSLRLTFEVKADMFGQFQCRAWNPLLREAVYSEVAKLVNEVRPSDDLPDILWDLPASLVVGEGHDLILPCKSTELTEPTKISWYLGDYRVDESKRVYALLDAENSLGFFPVRQQDVGSYSCRAENSKGSVESPPLDLVIAYLGIEFAANPVDTFAVYGTTATLRCEPPDSIPEAIVFWYKDYLPLNFYDEDTEGRLTVVGLGDLQLASVRKSDKGLYYCEAYNNFTTPTSRTSNLAVLTVEGPPIITVPPTAVEIVKGSLLQLKCLVDADPTPAVTWLYEGRAVVSSSRVALVNRSQQLVISDVDKTWEGLFTCEASNSYGPISAEAYVTVIVPPESLQSIGSLVATAGESITIQCPVLSDPMPDFLWFYNNTQIYPEDLGAPSNLHWRVVLPDLIIENIGAENAGEFTCVGVNKGGSASSTGRLVVNVPPTVAVTPQSSTKVMGQQTTLTCAAEGQPTPSIRWLYNTSKDLPADAELSGDNTTLTLRHLNWSHVGLYTCEAENLVGLGQVSAQINLMTRPRILAVEAPESAVKVDTRVILKCTADGIPATLLTWTHHNHTVVSLLNGRVHLAERGVLVIESVLLEDAGQYECVASSEVGEDKAGITLVVYGPPPPPVLLKAVPLSEESVYLIWEWSSSEPHSEQSVDTFRIWYREKQAVTPVLYPITLGNTSTRHEVTGLKAHQEYVFYVMAHGDSGSSIPSNLMSVFTLQSDPGVPENLRTTEISRRSATLVWEVPALQNGVVAEFQLRYKRVGYIYGDYIVLNITHPDLPTHELTLADLRPHTEYTVEVRAGNVQSGKTIWGEFGQPLVFLTLMAEPSLPPQFVEVSSRSPYSLQVSWQPIPALGQNGPILFYHVTYTNLKTEESEHRIEDRGTTSLTIFGLSPWRDYSVVVKGENSIGSSPSSETVKVQTLPIAPVAPPGNLKVKASSASTFTLSWEALPEQLLTCNITMYRVEYRQQGTSPWTSKNISSDFLQLQVDYLSPWTWYEVRVAAVTSSLAPGLGPFTEPVLARTQQGESESVKAVTYSISEARITLSWQPPEEVHGTLVGYKVSYGAVSDSPAQTVPQEIFVYYNKTLTLNDLQPNTLYEIKIAAVNGAGPGRETTLKLRTFPLSTVPLTTEFEAYEVSSEGTQLFNDSEINLSQSSTSSHIKKNLAAIVAGCLVGAVALTVCTIFVCVQCIRYRRKQRLNYDVSEDRVIIETDGSFYRPNESPPPVAEEVTSSTKPSLSFFSSSAPTQQLQQPPSSSSSLPATRNIVSSQPKLYTSQTSASTQSVNNTQPRSKTISQTSYERETDTDSVSSRSTATTGNDGTDDSAQLVRLSKQDLTKKRGSGERGQRHVPTSKKYSKLDEDLDSSQRSAGLENPMYRENPVDPALDVDDVVLMVDNSLSSFSHGRLRQSQKSFDDTDSVTSDTLRRKNRMRTESAAAIAAMRSTIYVDSLDMAAGNSRSILGNLAQNGGGIAQEPNEVIEDFGSEVIFNERTVL